MPDPAGICVLLIDDSADDVVLVLDALARAGTRVVVWARVESAAELRAALERDWDVALLDWRMPGFGGREALELLAREHRAPPVIVVSGDYPRSAEIAAALQLGADGFCRKGDVAELARVIDGVLLAAGGSLLERTAALVVLREPDG